MTYYIILVHSTYIRMKVLSIDVGIKNLAFCLFEKCFDDSTHFKIIKWDVVNISEQNSLKCGFIDKTGICNKPAKYGKNNICFCLKHSKKQQYFVPTSDLKPTFINKQKLQKLHEIAEKYKIKYESPIKKAELLEIIHNYIHNTCFEEIGTTNASKVDLITIGKNIKNKFDAIFKNEGVIHHVIIENQISPIANRMKTIQGMIAQYFIMNETADNIEFISASNKLKSIHEKAQVNDDNITNEIVTLTNNDENNNNNNNKNVNKTKYGERKKMGITKCLEALNNDPIMANNMGYHFNTHAKKDDLADSFLQGLWYIQNKLKIIPE